MTFLIIMYSLVLGFNEQDIGPELLGRHGLEATVGMIAAHAAAGKQTARRPHRITAPVR